MIRFSSARMLLPCILGIALLLAPQRASAQYYPGMVYGTPQQVAPGVTRRRLTNASPLWSIDVIEIDMTNRNVELMPVFKAAGNVTGSANERTSSMAGRTDGVAAVNAGYYDVTATSPGYLRTNSYTEIDGQFIGGSGALMRPENNRSVVGFSGDHQAIAKRTKLSNTFVPADATNWDKIVDAIAGRGHFVTSGGLVITQDNEGTGVSHYDARHPRTAIGYKASPYRAYLVTVDGRQPALSVGMTYTELAQLMADLGIEQSISLDGGGSTTCWVKGTGIVNSPSDGSERSVVSAWVVVSANTMDNTTEEVSFSGTWTTDTAHAYKYHTDQRITTDTEGPASATWTPNLAEAGMYKVYAWWTTDTLRASAAPYEVIHTSGTANTTANQKLNGGKWNILGGWPFAAGAGGSVTLRNTAPGSVSADALRFVRYSDIPGPIDPGYAVVGTLYESDFETDESSDFTVSQQVAGDNSINFMYDYSTFAQVGGGFPATIPPAPAGPTTGTRAIRMATNLNNGVLNGITATLTGISGQQNMRISFDAWINYNGGSGGGTGSTEHLTAGASANPALPAMAANNYLSGTAQPFNGFYFSIAGEGGLSQDYRYYDGNGSGAANGNNGARANFLGTGAINHTDFTGVYPSGLYETSGAPGKTWQRWEIIVLNGKIRLITNKPDATQTLMCNWFDPNANATMSGLLPHFGTMDLNAGVASPGSDNFVLIDNLLVQSISPPAAVGDWMLY